MTGSKQAIKQMSLQCVRACELETGGLAFSSPDLWLLDGNCFPLISLPLYHEMK